MTERKSLISKFFRIEFYITAVELMYKYVRME